MKATDLNPPAFARPMGNTSIGGDFNYDQEGMSLRDYFAGIALAAIIQTDVSSDGNNARRAYAQAAAMLDERNRLLSREANKSK